MVAIQRRTRSKSKPGLITCRNVILFLVVAQALSMLLKIMSGSATPPSTSVQPGDPPKSIVDRLKDSQGGLRPPLSKKNIDKNKKIPVKVPPTSLHHDDHPINNGEKEESDETPSDEVHIDADEDPDLPDQHNLHPRDSADNPTAGSANHQKALSRTGSGPTNVGYLKDFEYERENPLFRMTDLARDAELVTKVAKMVGETSVKPCETLSDRQILRDAKCTDSDTPLIAYNSAPFPRTWCGHTVEPNEAVRLDQACGESAVRFFPTDFPPVSGSGMSAIVIKSHDDVVSTSDLENVECNIPCQQEKGMDGPFRYVGGENWKFTQTMGDSWRSTTAMIERVDFRKDHYYSTQSFKSSVPLSFFSFDKYSLANRPAVDWETVQNKAVYMIQTNCASSASRRNKYFGAVSDKYQVDALGACGHNAPVPAGETMETLEGRVNIMKKYRMVLAYDYMTEKDHISDIVWESFMSGAVPVFIGANNARDHFPPHSAIYGGDYQSWDDMAKYVKEVAENKTLWQSFHKWRSDDQALKTFEEKYKFTRTSPTCRMCKWAYAKKFGMGWNHAAQEVTEPKLPRHLCISSSKGGLVSKPFTEQWVVRRLDHDENEVLKADEGATESCSELTAEGTLNLDSFEVHRTIQQHDSITDMIISEIERHNTDGELVLRLKLPGIRNQDGAYFSNTHSLVATVRGPLISSATIQDEFAKVTVLANWETRISSPQEGVMEVVIQKGKETGIPEGESRRIRVITEDTSVLHDKMTEYFPSSFAKIVTRDFADPLELFYVDS
jgi:hypothetical protein